MKKYIAPLVVLGTAIFLAATANAQTAGASTPTVPAEGYAVQGKAPRINSPKILLGVLKQLNTTPDQSAKIKEIVKANSKELLALRKSVAAGTLSKEDAKAKQKALRKSLIESIKGVLTADQAKQFEPLLKAETKKAREEAKASGSTATAPAKVGG